MRPETTENRYGDHTLKTVVQVTNWRRVPKDGKLVLAGLQTEYCIDATCKAAFEHGYEVIIPRGTVTTFDNDFCLGEDLTKYYEERIWNHRFVEVLPVVEVVAEFFEG